MRELGMRGELWTDLSNAIAQRDHHVEALRNELVEVLGAVGADVDPALSHDPYGIGVQRLGMTTGARCGDRAARTLFEDRLGHLRAGAVACAQEQHARSTATPRAAW